MPAQVLADLEAAVTKTKTVEDSAVTLINGIAARIQAAVNAALANGATAEELAPVTAEVANLNSAADALAAAVQANTEPLTGKK
jgi:hypothetical protein